MTRTQAVDKFAADLCMQMQTPKTVTLSANAWADIVLALQAGIAGGEGYSLWHKSWAGIIDKLREQLV